MIQYYKGVGYFWIRILNGYGLHIKDTKRNPLLFSQRYGYSRFLKVGKYAITLLKPHTK